MSLSLAPLGPNDLERVAHITVAPDQIIYSGTVCEALKAAEQGIDFHAILERIHPVGFFKIDRNYPATYPFATEGSLGFAGLYDRSHLPRPWPRHPHHLCSG